MIAVHIYGSSSSIQRWSTIPVLTSVIYPPTRHSSATFIWRFQVIFDSFSSCSHSHSPGSDALLLIPITSSSFRIPSIILCVIDYFLPATSFIIRHSGGWIHLHPKNENENSMGKKGFRHPYSWVIFSFGYQVGRVVCHGQCYPFIDGNLILEWTMEATIRLSRRSRWPPDRSSIIWWRGKATLCTMT